MPKKQLNIVPAPFSEATGPIAVTLRNDMMFHKAMNCSKTCLKELICSLKGLRSSEVKEVVVTNPIDYSEFTNKQIILDVKVLLNNNEILDIELQLYHDKYWEKRSLLYLCRTYDSIGESEKYEKLNPTTLVAIMDNPMFPKYPEFYSRYQLLNIKNHTPYSTLINLNVLYLNQIKRATDEDIANGLVYWAELFKSNTWESLRAICAQKPEFTEVANIMYNSNVIQSQEKTIFEAHQRYLRELDTAYSEIEEYKQENEALKAEKARLTKLLKAAGIDPDKAE